jgi:hypothetical protein
VYKVFSTLRFVLGGQITEKRTPDWRKGVVMVASPANSQIFMPVAERQGADWREPVKNRGFFGS